MSCLSVVFQRSILMLYSKINLSLVYTYAVGNVQFWVKLYDSKMYKRQRDDGSVGERLAIKPEIDFWDPYGGERGPISKVLFYDRQQVWRVGQIAHRALYMSVFMVPYRGVRSRTLLLCLTSVSLFVVAGILLLMVDTSNCSHLRLDQELDCCSLRLRKRFWERSYEGERIRICFLLRLNFFSLVTQSKSCWALSPRHTSGQMPGDFLLWKEVEEKAGGRQPALRKFFSLKAWWKGPVLSILSHIK